MNNKFVSSSFALTETRKKYNVGMEFTCGAASRLTNFHCRRWLPHRIRHNTSDKGHDCISLENADARAKTTCGTEYIELLCRIIHGYTPYTTLGR